MEVTRSEDCLIFNGLTPEITKMNRVYDALAEFMKRKQANDASDRFNFIVFQEDGPNYLNNFTLYPNYILETLKSLNPTLTRANVAGGIFVAVTFIIEVYKKISEKIFRLIILVDEGSRRIPSQFVPVLEDLIDKVKDMPFFIDIIRIYDQDFQEGQKLLKLAKRCNGELYDIDNVRDLSQLLIKLSEKKYIRIPEYYFKPITPKIPNESQLFYINLADEPIEIKQKSTCAICFQKDDYNIVQCPSCEILAHKTCWAQWAKTTNIGIPHVFRCHNCYNILKLDRDFVLDVQAGKIPTAEQLREIKVRNIVEYLQDLEAEKKPDIIHVPDPMAIEGEATEYAEDFTENYVHERKKSDINVLICPNCSKIATSMKRVCPYCGFQLF
ncbi:MAG: hypothetical protein ACFFA6_17150 [Promethearchaeota archaeon]